MNYLSWNDAIAAHFFKSEMAGRKVHLFVSRELLDEIGSVRGDDTQGFLRAVNEGPHWSTPGAHLCEKALQSIRNWPSRGCTYPPYIGYLALFVAAAGVEANFADHAYYPRLRLLLGQEPETKTLEGFDRMGWLWRDLEKWSNLQMGGELGNFNYFLAGKRVHVDLPRAQLFLTSQEMRFLPQIFARAGLDPDSLPPAAEMCALLLKYGQNELRARTLKLLREGKTGQSPQGGLLDTILEELSDWSGIAGEDASADAGVVLDAVEGEERARVSNASLGCAAKSTAARARRTSACGVRPLESSPKMVCCCASLVKRAVSAARKPAKDKAGQHP